MIDLEPLLDALRSARPDGSAIVDWSVHLGEGSRSGLGIKDREIGNPHAPLQLAHAASASYLLVWDDGRVSRGRLERRQIEHEPYEALVAARAGAYDDPDAGWVLGPAAMPEVELHDQAAALAAQGDPTWIEPRLLAVRERVDAHGVRTWSGSFSASEGHSRVVTSRGLDVVSRGTSVGWHVTLEGEASDGHAARAPESQLDFERRLDRLLETLRALGCPLTPLAGGMRPVILHPRVVRDYVLDTLLHHLDGGTVAHGEGRFSREQFGSNSAVLREDLSLRLDPLEPLGLGSYRFTSEGVPAARCSYIERGCLVQPACGLKFARRLGRAPTPLPYGADGLQLATDSSVTLDEALALAQGGVLILGVLGVHTQDKTSGDFSLAAPQTLGLGPGGYAGRLRVTISGNLFDVLRGAALRPVRFEGESIPGLLFSCRVDPRDTP